MLLVPYELRRGPYGTGLYATRDVPKGEVVYTLQPAFLLTITDQELKRWPIDARNRFLRHAYRGQGVHRRDDAYYYNADDSRFMNHADHPSLQSVGEGEIYLAARDLKAGEELTCDYADFAQRGEACFNF